MRNARVDPNSGSGVPPLRPDTATYLDPGAPIAFLSGDLPHWRQDGVTYFVSFRLADSLPAEKLSRWRQERNTWMLSHPEPHDEATRREYYERFPHRLQLWLDAGSGSCVLAMPEVKALVDSALRHFAGRRYRLGDFAIACNHVHALVTPLGVHRLSAILHSWKSFTAHEILKVEAASRRIRDGWSQSGSGVAPLDRRPMQRRDASATCRVWQKESFDHIVRSPDSLTRFRQYILGHGTSPR